MFPDCVNNFIDRNADLRTKDNFFASSVWKPITIISLYLLFVNKIGPWYMKDRKPYNVKKWIIAFDIIQIVLNFYIAVEATSTFFEMEGTFFCLDFDASDSPTARKLIFLANAYHMLKLSDMIDTVFFILKASYRQASYLHVYHHSAMIFFSWIGLKFIPGGQSLYIGITNSVVHTIMYSYYLLSTIDEKYRKDLSIKKFVTRLQMAQFSFLLVMYISSSRPSCNYPTAMSVFCVLQSIYFLYLFGQFYYNTYIIADKRDKKH